MQTPHPTTERAEMPIPVADQSPFPINAAPIPCEAVPEPPEVPTGPVFLPVDDPAGSLDCRVAGRHISKQIARAGDPKPLPFDPAVLLAAARMPVPEGATASVEQGHSARWDAVNGEQMALLERMQIILGNAIRRVSREVQQLTGKLDGTDQFQVVDGTANPMTWGAWIFVFVLYLVAIAAIAVDIGTLAGILLSSGLPGFTDPWRCYAFSATPIALVAALEALGHTVFAGDRAKVRFTGVILFTGVTLAIGWAFTFSSLFSTFSSTTEDILLSALEDGPQDSRGQHGGKVLVVFALLGNAMLAAGCSLAAEVVLSRRRSRRSVRNAVYKSIQREVEAVAIHKSELELLNSRAASKAGAFRAARAAYLAGARDRLKLARESLERARDVDQVLDQTLHITKP